MHFFGRIFWAVVSWGISIEATIKRRILNDSVVSMISQIASIFQQHSKDNYYESFDSQSNFLIPYEIPEKTLSLYK